MWKALIAPISSIFTAWIESKKAKYEAEKNFQLKLAEQESTWDLVALRQAQFSWKDEIITIIIFTPLILAWFPGLRDDVQAWVDFVGKLPLWYQAIMFGIVAASFGLRWWFKQTGLKLPAANK